jgi:glycosyltransferase involved in cell wall biosynthesis
MDWTPNQDAILYFAEAILPKIQKELGDASLWVVGRKPSERLKELARKLPGIHVTGAVDDIRPYIARSAVYVVPIRIGGGTRIKIYEAMAMGKPVVSTTVGAEGLPVENGRDLFLEDDPERFAAVVVQLLRSPRLSRQLGEAARRLVETSYSWAAVAGELAETLERFQAGHAQKDELAHAGR